MVKLREIAGVSPKTVKAKIWREIAGFNPLNEDGFKYGETVEKIALIYGLDVETVENEIDIDEIIPLYYQCVDFISSIVVEKIKQIPKNAEEEGVK